MAKLVWDASGERFFEHSVSRAVFYGEDKVGVAWNGLLSVEEKGSDSAEPLYFDGVRYSDLVTVGDFEGSMKAFTYPDEFLAYEGIAEIEDGFFVGNQPKKRFALCYRTEVGNDEDQNVGYKIHLIYNVLALPSTKEHETLALTPEPLEFEWDISAVPVRIDKHRPSAHLIFDSRKLDPYLMADVEAILYGSDTTDPMLPDFAPFVTFMQNWGRLVIVDYGDGTWSASSSIPGVISMLDSETFQITSDTATYLDADSYTIESDDPGTGDL